MGRVAFLALLASLTFPWTSALEAQRAAPSASEGEVRGGVSTTDGRPIAGAQILVRSGADTTQMRATTTGANGSFRIGGLAPGRYSVRIRYMGHTTYDRDDVVITAGQRTIDAGTIRLSPVAVGVEGIEVTGERSSVTVAVDRTIYSTKDMPAAAAGVATDVLRNVPELEVDMDGKVSHRGAVPQIHINGRPVPVRGEALDQFLQQFPASRIDRIEVIPNPSASFDAEGSGGIVNIVLRQNASLGISGNVSVNAGTKSRRGATGRLAYQQGRLTLFGGAGANVYRRSIVNNDLREHLLARPITFLEQEQRGANEISSGSIDLSAELRLDDQTVLWSSASGYLSGYDWSGTWYNSVQDADRLPTERYNRSSQSTSLGLTSDFVLGLKRAMGGAGHELSLELRRSGRDYDKEGRYGRTWFEVPGRTVDQVPDRRDHDDRDDSGGLTIQTDYTRPLGKRIQLELGYRGSIRESDTEALQRIFVPIDASVPLDLAQNRYLFREEFHAGYLLFGGTFGRLRAQVGARGERAATEFELPILIETFNNQYSSLFPSANLAYDFGHGRQAKLMYSKRIERPGAAMLNPYDPQPDPVNRRVGNPYLNPQYTHTFTLDLSRSGQRGTLRFSPYLYRTESSWENIKRVDAAGLSTITWANFASTRSYGSSVTASLQPSRLLSGSLTFNMYRVEQDASNVSVDFSRDDLRWSSSANVVARLSPTRSLQSGLNVYSARDVGQAQIDRIINSTVGGRQQLWQNKASINLWINDPFDLYRNRFVTQDASHVQTGKTRWSNRMMSLSLSYNFGKTPRSERKVQTSDQPTQQEVQVEIR